MRISDWSSDVCSSDLDALHLVAGAACVQQQVGAFARQPQGGGPADAPRGAGDESGLSGQKAIAFLWQDRKSVVWGKSVSVSVDLGGRRIMKKKNTKNTRD